MAALTGPAVCFWGVRGSIATPGPDTMRYGGNTACVEVRCGDALLIFDGGTGLRPLGHELVQRGIAEMDIFYSHLHVDHCCGLPFFTPAYQEGNRIHLWAGNLLPDFTLEQTLRKTMEVPYFPTELEIFKAHLEFHDFRAGDVLRPRAGVVMHTQPLNHPGGATGYRLDYGGKALTYLTDTEHHRGQLDANILALAEGADLMIYDATYTEEEFVHHIGWGHSTWEQAVALADAAHAKTLVIFHHDPEHDDAFMDRTAAAAAAARPGTLVAREGMVLQL